MADAFRLETVHRHADPDDGEGRDLPWGEHICIDHKPHAGKARDCMAILPRLAPASPKEGKDS